MSGGKNRQPSPSNARGPMRFTKDASLASTEKAHGAFLGYTIVEVMIFLAVSSLMFVIAAEFVNGKQDQVQFRNDVSSLNTAVKDAIDNVADGYYSEKGTLTCPAYGGPPLAQGSNASCIFLGDTMYFSQNDYTLQSIAGNRLSSGTEVTSLGQARPTLISNTQSQQSLGGVFVRLICVTSLATGSAQESYAFAVVNSLNQDIAAPNSSGAVNTVSLYGYSTPVALGATPNMMTLTTDQLSKVIIYVSNAQTASAGERDASVTINSSNGLSQAVHYLDAIPGACP